MSFVKESNEEKSFVIDNNTYYDINGLQYTPQHNPNGLAASHLLDLSFKKEKVSEYYYQATRYIQNQLGINKTVWGYKQDLNGEPLWEYYFYYYKTNPLHTYSNIHRVLSGLINFTPQIETVNDHYYLISFILTEKKANCINIYFPDIDSLNDEDDLIYVPNHDRFFSRKESLFRAYGIEANKTELTPGKDRRAHV